MGVNSSQRLGVVVLPYKAAEAEGGRGRVGGEESQHPAAGAEALAAVEPEAREPLRRPPASSGPLPASAVRPPGGADPKEYGRTHGLKQLAALRPRIPSVSLANPRKAKASLRGPGHTPNLIAQSECTAEND